MVQLDTAEPRADNAISKTALQGTEQTPTVETTRVACPDCGEFELVPAPAEDVELKIRTTVAAFGEHTKRRCSRGHTSWVCYC
ncbi:MAG: hypothetical protein ACQET5_07715 [Halobacteriota archaeon]|uniref:hypothetical protein n=1 Tax=Natronomonas sp. TaxID=2184060 RepID=UPI0039756A6E